MFKVNNKDTITTKKVWFPDTFRDYSPNGKLHVQS